MWPLNCTSSKIKLFSEDTTIFTDRDNLISCPVDKEYFLHASTGLHVLCVPKDYKIVFSPSNRSDNTSSRTNQAIPGALNGKLPMLHVRHLLLSTHLQSRCMVNLLQNNPTLSENCSFIYWIKETNKCLTYMFILLLIND